MELYFRLHLSYLASKSELLAQRFCLCGALTSYTPCHPRQGRDGLVVASRLWCWRAPGSKPDSTEDPPCMGPVVRQILRWRGVEAWRGGCHLRCRHLTLVQNHEVRPKIALVLLQSGTLI
ncbi:hypothetical protein AVEN_185316-1 [Araneus ventricosus]|uniref:Uncharacterized protein n=1 Tax=Araneus ventricosus TaxID=182803 RepID=A0A4Y2MUU0_ARAVE|nr:hypothetical protein AVEN_185316-1 [Araneus ventricosus]